MGKNIEIDLVRQAQADIYGGCRDAILAGVNGNIPQDYQATGIVALPSFDAGEHLKVLVQAFGPLGEVGAKIGVAAPVDYLKLADEAARQITEAIGRKKHPRGVPVVKFMLEPGAMMPTRGSAGASGYDLYAPADVLIRPGQVVVIHSGVSLEMPDDTWEAQIRPRSGMSKRGLWVAIGTVDSDYRGAFGATVVNLGKEDAKVEKGHRYAQLVFARVAHPVLEVVETLGASARGSAGFGSTGQ